MKFAVQHGVGDPGWRPEIFDPQNVISWSRAVEETGWAGIAFTDHPAPSSRWVNGGGEGSSDPFSSLAFCAAVTTDVKLLTWVLVLPYRNPFFTAHQVSTLDRLSGGRLMLGLGTGYLRGEFKAAGIDFEHRLADFDEALELLKTGFTQDEIVLKGRTFDAPGTVIQPNAVQLPHPPLWIHGNSRWGIERAARSGDGWLCTLTTPMLARTIRTAHVPDLAAVRERLSMLRRELDRIGRDPAEVEIAVSGAWPMLDIRNGWDTDKVLSDVGELEALGATWIVSNAIGDDAAASEDTVRRFGDQIVQAAR